MHRNHNDYFFFLCELVHVDGRYSDETYYQLAEVLDHMTFTWILDMDENRAIWGEGLRDQYYYESGSLVDASIDMRGASVLEVLIALAQAMARTMDELDDEDMTPRWFWEMVDNLGLTEYTDTRFQEQPGLYDRYCNRIAGVIYRWLRRDFAYDGHGSPFPLRKAKEDQRKVDIWYQAQGYMCEHYK